jgi:DNA-binding transcriptional LysR family regulator
VHQPASVLFNRLLARGRFRHVQVLAQLAELGSVRRTAEKVGMTQPGVTQILADLESLVGTPLFHRHARGVRPTAACADLLPLARQLLLGMGAAAEAVAQRRGLGEGVVRVVATTASVNGLLVRALPAFNDHDPSVQVHLKEDEIDDGLLAIARGQADLVCARRVDVVPEGWQFQPLVPDRFVVVCAPDHPLARKRRVGWDQLATQAWLPAPTGSIARAEFDARAAQFPAPPPLCQIITRVPSTTWALLRHRPLLTLVPFGVVRHLVESGELALVNQPDPMPLPPLGMLLPVQDMSPATARLAAFLRDHAAQTPPYKEKGTPR